MCGSLRQRAERNIIRLFVSLCFLQDSLLSGLGVVFPARVIVLQRVRPTAPRQHATASKVHRHLFSDNLQNRCMNLGSLVNFFELTALEIAAATWSLWRARACTDSTKPTLLNLLELTMAS